MKMYSFSPPSPDYSRAEVAADVSGVWLIGVRISRPDFTHHVTRVMVSVDKQSRPGGIILHELFGLDQAAHDREPTIAIILQALLHSKPVLLLSIALPDPI